MVGRPSWDVRSLRSLLKRNPNVDLVSFFILRTNESVDSARTNELSLIPFPTNELFYEELGSFDLVVSKLHLPGSSRVRQYLPRIRDFVENGGGFVMVGGEQSLLMEATQTRLSVVSCLWCCLIETKSLGSHLCLS